MVFPRWANGDVESNITGNGIGDACSYSDRDIGDGYQVHPDSHKMKSPFDKDVRSNDVYKAYDCYSSESECVASNLETSNDSLEGILTHLVERERKEWADGMDVSQSKTNVGMQDDIVNMLRKTIFQMDVNSEDLGLQRLGTRIIYYLSKLQHNKKIDTNQKVAGRWYEIENTIISSDAISGDEGDELMTDALEAILQSMEAFPDDEDLVENACLVFECTSEHKNINSNAKRIFEEVLLAIEGFADNPILISSSLGLLCNLSSPSKINSSDGLRRKLAKYALPSILQGMKEHREDIELYTKGCQVMANFTKEDPNAQRMLTCKETLGLRIISEGLKCWDEDHLDDFTVIKRLRLQLAAIKVLKNLSTHHSLEVKGKIALGGGAAQIIERLLEALVFIGAGLINNNFDVGDFDANQIYQVDEDDEVGISLAIMQNVLQTIENLANIESAVTKDERSPHIPTVYRNSAIDNSSAEDIQRQLSKAVKPVLDTIRQHPNRRSLQYNGLVCAQQLTISHANSIANHGGISTFLNVLSSSAVADTNDSTIHEQAVSCLTGLLSPSSNADGLDLVASIETENGIDAIFSTIRRFQSDTAIIETGYESLFYLSCRVRVVLSSIVGHHPSIVCGVGAHAARRLQSQLCLEENIFVMLGTLNQYFESSESISQRGLGLLLNVHAFLTEQQQRHMQSDVLVSNGGIRLVLAVMRRHGLAVGIQEYGVGLFAGILKSDTSYNAIRREFFDEEGISTVLAAMIIHPGHAAVQSHGCDVLIQLLTINKLPLEDEYLGTVAVAAYYKKCILEETNAVAVVQDSMDRFRTHKVVQYFGTALLQELSSTTAVRPLAALPSKAASISMKLQSSILSSTSKMSSSLRSSLE